jgi:hypothetical protein
MVVNQILKQVHDLVVEKAKPKKLLTFEEGIRHQDHAKMNARILGNAMTVQRWNDQKVVICAHEKT